MLKLSEFKNLSNKLGFGDVFEDPKPLSGGALHSMYHIKASEKDFVIKVLNPLITKNKGFKENYETSEKISSAFLKKDIPSVPAIKINNACVQKINGDFYIAYPFIEGEIYSSGAVKKSHIEKVGLLFSQLHSANLSGFDSIAASYDVFENHHWMELIKKSKIKGMMALEDKICSWNERYLLALKTLRTFDVVSHRDMHNKNILWDKDEKPHIVDWESAGKINPAIEIIGYGLEWSGIILNGEIDYEILQTLLASYQKQECNYPLNKYWLDAFYGWLGHCVLAWTEFNLNRALVVNNNKERDIGLSILNDKMVPCLHYLNENEKTILEMIRKSIQV